MPRTAIEPKLINRRKGWLNKCYLTSNDDPSNNGHKGGISNPSLPLKSHQISKQGSEERRRGTHSLIKRDRKVPKWNVATHNRPTKHSAQSRNLGKLRPRFHRLQRNDFEKHNGDVTEDRTCWHVAHCEKNWKPEAIIWEQILVQ